jgi:hypothetical protein
LRKAAYAATESAQPDEPIAIEKPSAFNLEAFKSKRSAAIASVKTLPVALPHHKVSQAKDFVRLHPDEAYWSSELCFVNVPVKGMKRDTLHLIYEDIALQFLSSGAIQRFRLVLATKPFDVLFLAEVPTQNVEDNTWNSSNVLGCEQSKTRWVKLTSRKAENVDSYKIEYAHDADAFPEPKWPTQALDELIGLTFAGRMITSQDHAGLKRLLGARQSVS